MPLHALFTSFQALSVAFQAVCVAFQTLFEHPHLLGVLKWEKVAKKWNSPAA